MHTTSYHAEKRFQIDGRITPVVAIAFLQPAARNGIFAAGDWRAESDLKTILYESVGDVNAYFLVRQHFEILNRIIRERSGTIIKTIGDAVMARFERPQDAVCASIEMIEELSRFSRTASATVRDSSKGRPNRRCRG
jgi:hypothetical protein